MKRKIWLTLPAALLIGCLLCWGAMGTLITAFHLPVDAIATLYWVWLLAGILSTLCFLLKKGWITALGILGALVWLWPDDGFFYGILALISRLSTIYHNAYGWDLITFSELPAWHSVPVDLVLGLWGCLILITATQTVIRGRGLLLTLLTSLLPVAATVVVNDTPAEGIYLFLVMLGVMVLALSATVRRQDPQEGAKLALLTTLPVSLFLGCLFWLCPQDAYVNRSQDYLDTVVNWFQSIPARLGDTTGLVEAQPSESGFAASTNLSRVGPRNKWGLPVMEVKTNYTDTVYLRGQVYHLYDGNSWDAAKDRQETFGIQSSAWVEGEYKTIEIRTNTLQDYLFVPYYTIFQPVKGGRVENELKDQSYTLVVQDLPSDRFHVSTFWDDDYLDLPETTKEWGKWYYRGILLEAGLDVDIKLTNAAKVDLIAEHVKNSATYSIKTPQMPSDQDDFVRWFLESSDTGYCVHFATATAVLLRAAGVPARYVTGYAFKAKADQITKVTSDQAHAWVEYYDEYLGAWMMVESTPPDFSQNEPETQPTETQPTYTAPPTNLTEPATDPEPVTQPLETPGTDTPSINRPGREMSWMLWLLVVPGLWLVVAVQYRIRRRLRRGDSPNAQALEAWAQVETICRLTKQDPPAELEELALKAKFSQHTLTPAEGAAFQTWLDAERRTLSPLKILFCRYILAIW